jgi:hypothetical protein
MLWLAASLTAWLTPGLRLGGRTQRIGSQHGGWQGDAYTVLPGLDPNGAQVEACVVARIAKNPPTQAPALQKRAFSWEAKRQRAHRARNGRFSAAFAARHDMVNG